MFNFPDEEEDDFIGGPVMAPPAPPPVAPEAAPPAMNPQVQDAVMKKFNLGPYSQEARDKLVKDNEVGFGDKGLAALAALGAGFQGKDSASAGLGVLNRAKQNQASKLDEFDKGRQNTIQNYTVDQQLVKDDRENAKSDPTSAQSETFRKMIEANYPQIVKAYGDNWSNVTAADQESIFKPLQLKEQTDARKQAAALLAGQRGDAREDRKLQRDLMNNEKQQKLVTPFGMANSEDDAKKLKDAFESKQNFDGKIDEMIALREKHGGGAILNREDVARGKQLSKDLLLEYKNMAKLGVLSAADEKIINAIIPADPLAFNSPMAAMQGQDPILGQLKKFKGDSDKDFQTRVGTRTRAGIGSVAEDQRRKLPPGDDKVEMIDPKGRRKFVKKDQVAAAEAAGGQRVKGANVGGL